MFEYIKGKVAELNPTEVIIETNLIGYQIHISLNTFAVLEGVSETSLYLHEVVREDAFTLFGFATKEERALFRLLTSVSGIGANTARMILSSYSVSELESIIANENVNQLKGIKGIGLKTAQRIIVDLKDKVAGISGDNALPVGGMRNETKEEAVTALVLLGFNKAVSSKVVDKIISEVPDIPLEKIIKEALKRI